MIFIQYLSDYIQLYPNTKQTPLFTCIKSEVCRQSERATIGSIFFRFYISPSQQQV